MIGVSRIEPEKRIARFMTVYSKRVARFITVCEVGIKYSFKLRKQRIRRIVQSTHDWNRYL